MAWRPWIRGPVDKKRFSKFDGLYCSSETCNTDEMLVVDPENGDICCSYCGCIVNQESDLEQDRLESFESDQGRVATMTTHWSEPLVTAGSGFSRLETALNSTNFDKWMAEYSKIVRSLCGKVDASEQIIQLALDWGRRMFNHKQHTKFGKVSIAVGVVSTLSNAMIRSVSVESLVRVVLTTSNQKTISKRVKGVREWIRQQDPTLYETAAFHSVEVASFISPVLFSLKDLHFIKVLGKNPFQQEQQFYQIQMNAIKIAQQLQACPFWGGARMSTLAGISIFCSLMLSADHWTFSDTPISSSMEVSLMRQIALVSDLAYRTLLNRLSEAIQKVNDWIPSEQDAATIKKLTNKLTRA